MTPSDIKAPPNFIRTIIEEDIRTNKNEGRVITRFPLSPMDIFTSATPNQYA